jgi:hypothetical protein
MVSGHIFSCLNIRLSTLAQLVLLTVKYKMDGILRRRVDLLPMIFHLKLSFTFFLLPMIFHLKLSFTFFLLPMIFHLKLSFTFFFVTNDISSEVVIHLFYTTCIFSDIFCLFTFLGWLCQSFDYILI